MLLPFAVRVSVVEAEGETGVETAGPAGWGCMLLAVIVGYFAWFGMVGS